MYFQQLPKLTNFFFHCNVYKYEKQLFMVKPPLIEWYFPQIKVVLSVRVYVLNKIFFCTSSFSSSCHLELSLHLEAPASVSEIIVE
jgi:hypothetical protein